MELPWIPGELRRQQSKADEDSDDQSDRTKLCLCYTSKLGQELQSGENAMRENKNLHR